MDTETEEIVDYVFLAYDGSYIGYATEMEGQHALSRALQLGLSPDFNPREVTAYFSIQPCAACVDLATSWGLKDLQWLGGQMVL